ncbi:hypothetical protein [Brevundimonas sp.]|uniref:hypothetical protein n=1 Tax=Brevundimonas sp. TaxID=1871086 RepID=UPI0025BA33D9|nr:hypothetical protein [Brevundimonas sp.]
MTETLSISEAMATPLRVIRRHPLAVFVWGFSIAAFSLLLAVLVFGTLGNIPLSNGAEPPPELVGRLVALQGVTMLFNVAQLVLGVTIWTATARATLRIGRPDKWFFMRLSMDELRVGVVGIALLVGTYFAVLIVVAVGTLAGFIVWQISQAAAIILGAVLFLALIAFVAVAMARLSLIAPTTLILGRLAFVEGWQLGRKRTLPLLGLLVSTWLAYALVYVIIAFVVIVALFASGVFANMEALGGAGTLGDMFPSAPVLWGVALLVLGPGGFIYGSVLTLLSAPFTSAARQLLDGAPEDGAHALV